MSRPPLADDYRVTEPGPPRTFVHRWYRWLCRRLLGWWMGPTSRSVEDLVHREASERYEAIESVVARVAALEQQGLAARMALLERTHREIEPAGPAGSTSGGDLAPSASGSQAFTFGLHFRGDETALEERATWYIERLGRPPGRLVDLGCGRGTLLRVFEEAGWTAVGVDTSADAVSHCRARGLDVRQRDALDFLRSRPSASVDVVIASHVLEHCPPVEIAAIVSLVCVVLVPGGCFIVEAPNPSSFAGVRSHFVDPTHTVPLHPETMGYFLSHGGFAHVETVFLDPVPSEHRLMPITVDRTDPRAGALERVSRNFALLDEVVYGHLAYCCMGYRPDDVDEAMNAEDGTDDGARR